MAKSEPVRLLNRFNESVSAPATSSEGLFVTACAEVAGIHGYRTDELLGWRRKR